MASTSPSCYSLRLTNSSFCMPNKAQKCLQVVRSQSFSTDEGNPTNNNVVDGNLSILRRRIERLRNEERLGSCFKLQNGWNYQHVYVENRHNKQQQVLMQSVEIVGLISRTIGLVFLTGSFCIFLVSFFVHLQDWFIDS